jgi:hypothetical protein
METACCTCATGKWSTALPPTDMRKLWRGIVNTIFWYYERGSWPYDVMVVVILVFVLLTPRRWFHDQPAPTVPAVAGVQVVPGDAEPDESTYRIDAQLLAAEKRATKITPELERETHDILGRTVPELNGHAFQVVRIVPLLSDSGSVLYYDVTVQ